MVNSNEILNIIYSVIQRLYIYCHLYSNSDETPDEIQEDLEFDTAIMAIIICILSFSIIKMCLIFVPVFIITIIKLGKFFIRLFRKKCCLNIFQEIKYAYFYLVKIFKKFYTNNFYSYENKTFGAFFVGTYMMFILFNFIFTLDHAVIDCEDNNKNKTIRILQIISFEFNIFIELVCCTFFIFRNFKKQFIIIIISFLLLNSLIALVIFYKIQNNLAEEEMFDKSTLIARLIFLTFFSSLAIFSLKIISNYNLSCILYINLFSRILEVFH